MSNPNISLLWKSVLTRQTSVIFLKYYCLLLILPTLPANESEEVSTKNMSCRRSYKGYILCHQTLIWVFFCEETFCAPSAQLNTNNNPVSNTKHFLFLCSAVHHIFKWWPYDCFHVAKELFNWASMHSPWYLSNQLCQEEVIMVTWFIYLFICNTWKCSRRCTEPLWHPMSGWMH